MTSVKVAAVQAVDVAMFASGYFKVIKTKPRFYQIFLLFSFDVKYVITPTLKIHSMTTVVYYSY